MDWQSTLSDLTSAWGDYQTQKFQLATAQADATTSARNAQIMQDGKTAAATTMTHMLPWLLIAGAALVVYLVVRK
jgi:hypothetical protein